MAFVAAAIAGAALAYGVYSGEETKKQQRAAEAANDRANQKLEQEQKDQKLIEDATAARDRAKKKQASTQMGTLGRAGTFDTNPMLGFSALGGFTGKTLLGI